DFQHFIAYTAQVNAFAPAVIIPALAVIATIAEGSCGVLMVLGLGTRYAALASSALLFVFATSMMLSGLSQFQYNVYLMSVAAWALATIDAEALGADSLVVWLNRRQETAGSGAIARSGDALHRATR
ncbi:MAG: TQO small subunit DoxD, partial [Gemmatimonadota bacterium]